MHLRRGDAFCSGTLLNELPATLPQRDTAPPPKAAPRKRRRRRRPGGRGGNASGIGSEG